MPAQTTQERKTEAVQAAYREINSHTLPHQIPDGSEPWTAEQVARRIEALAPVIRSAKWQHAVERYAALIRAEGTDARSLVWAIGQGSVWFAYEAF